MTDEEIIQRTREQVREDPESPFPATPEAVAELEAAVGHPMPPLLKRIYLEVADGGFGRCGEALAVAEDYAFSDSDRTLTEYLRWRTRPGYPPSVVPLLTWGCNIWSLVDYSTPEGRTWGWDPHLEDPLFPDDYTLAQRLSGWLEGRNDFPKPPTPPGRPPS